MAYENMTIEDFLKDRLKSYGNVADTLHLFCDGVSPEYQAFHQKTLAKHTALVEVKYAGKTWQITRASNIRDTSGYLRYTIHLVREDKLGTAEPSVAFRFFRNGWEAWHTVPLAT